MQDIELPKLMTYHVVLNKRKLKSTFLPWTKNAKARRFHYASRVKKFLEKSLQDDRHYMGQKL